MAIKSEGNIYDRIFKENAESLFIPLIKQELNINIKKYKLLPEKLPKTIEREVDSLYEVVLDNNKKELIHIEFQTKDDTEMIFRMGMYHGLAFWKYKLPIKHIVIFLGKGKSKMRNKLKPEEVFKSFDIINVNTLDSAKLIQSQIPEVLVLSLLGKYKKEQTEEILRSILKKLRKVIKSKKELSKFQQQLIILSRLRKLENQTTKIVEEMPIEYNIETDYLYKRGIKKGLEQGIEKGEKIGRKEELEDVLEIYKFYKQGNTMDEISKKTGLTQSKIKKIIAHFKRYN